MHTRLRNLCESVSQESSKTLHDDAMLLHRDYLISSLGQVHIEIVQNNQFINFLNLISQRRGCKGEAPARLIEHCSVCRGEVPARLSEQAVKCQVRLGLG